MRQKSIKFQRSNVRWVFSFQRSSVYMNSSQSHDLFSWLGDHELQCA